MIEYKVIVYQEIKKIRRKSKMLDVKTYAVDCDYGCLTVMYFPKDKSFNAILSYIYDDEIYTTMAETNLCDEDEFDFNKGFNLVVCKVTKNFFSEIKEKTTVKVNKTERELNSMKRDLAHITKLHKTKKLEFNKLKSS